ncbi:type II toxin-antitoxin system VapC family toxin [Algoriphagus alkaliphilus]|uniref:type II toxin-antitoxin system VapC family toxin n=1 Tax=Algoriphagus alkaliphilus TaxID=279824 RepID=UPI000B8409BA|nr:type II toxin-antitoxin system VapC family toxin [Algoriphagus alkaliphilus]MBA4300429.1 PIN domain-containing protein [Cyclobacterium sp.]
MNGNRVFVDTNILLYFLKGEKPIVYFLLEKQLLISFIVELELLGFSKLEPNDLKLIKELLSHCQIIDIDPIIKEKTISIKQKSSLKLPDAVVLATSIRFSIPLITADKDFLRSNEKLVVWMDLS